jgi:hypothetical protein
MQGLENFGGKREEELAYLNRRLPGSLYKKCSLVVICLKRPLGREPLIFIVTYYRFTLVC